MKSTLLFGGSGYIGSALTASLLKGGVTVRIQDRVRPAFPTDTAPANEAVLLAWPRMEDQERMSELEEAYTIRDLEHAHDEILREVDHAVFVSSVQVLKPRNRYARSKLAEEERLLDTYGDRVTVIRLSTVHGPSPCTRWELILNAMVRDLFTRGVVHAQGPGIIRPHAYIEDVVRRIEEVLADRPGGRFLEGAPICSFCVGIGQVAADLTTAFYNVLGEKAEVIEEQPPRPTRGFAVAPTETYGYPLYHGHLDYFVEQMAPSLLW